jgi:hypothetical protein
MLNHAGLIANRHNDVAFCELTHGNKGIVSQPSGDRIICANFSAVFAEGIAFGSASAEASSTEEALTGGRPAPKYSKKSLPQDTASEQFPAPRL